MLKYFAIGFSLLLIGCAPDTDISLSRFPYIFNISELDNEKQEWFVKAVKDWNEWKQKKLFLIDNSSSVNEVRMEKPSNNGNAQMVFWDIIFNPSINWGECGEPIRDFKSDAIHELGHIYYLDSFEEPDKWHSNDPTHFMFFLGKRCINLISYQE